MMIPPNTPCLREDNSKNKTLEEPAHLEVDKSGTIVYANNSLLKMLSQDTDQVFGQSLNSVLPLASNNPKVFHYVWLGIQNGIIKKTDFVLSDKNKKECLIRFEITLHMNDKNEINKIIMISNSTVPVLEYKKYSYKSAQQALDEEEKRSHSIS